jgi:hypothetical protein
MHPHPSWRFASNEKLRSVLALRTDLRQMTLAVVAVAVTIGLCATRKEAKGKRNADRRMTFAAPAGAARALQRRARLSAFHHGSHQRDFPSLRLTSGQASCGGYCDTAALPAMHLALQS